MGATARAVLRYRPRMTDEPWLPEWCVVGNLLPYPYSPSSPKAEFRSQKIFPAGAKLYVLGGFPGPGYETVTVVGHSHNRRSPVAAHIKARYIGNWRAELVYRPALLRAFVKFEDKYNWNRWWLYERLPGGRSGRRLLPTEPAYGEVLAEVAAGFQRELHGDAWNVD